MSAIPFSSCEPLAPAARVAGVRPYQRSRNTWPITLSLDANEGVGSSAALARGLASIDVSTLCRYPDASELERMIAARHEVDPAAVLVTNGGDDVIDRLCRATLEPGRTALLHAPTFEMIARSVRSAGGGVRHVDWIDGPFPVARVINDIDRATALVVLVTPNNPTGAVINLADICAVAAAARAAGAVVLVDLAYVEFADSDPAPALREFSNVVLVRTFSKAKGLAGLRVGYAVASPEIIKWLRAAGGPYPVSSISLALAEQCLDDERSGEDYVRAVRAERAELTRVLTQYGAAPLPSQANFVTARFPDARFVRLALASLGIAVRGFAQESAIGSCLRITLPGGAESFDRLVQTLSAAMQPQALLFDLDGVLADVTNSYRAAITETARSFGVIVSRDDVAAGKRAGQATNDWILTQRLLEQRGISIPLEQVTERFQLLYLGDGGTPGLREAESLLPGVEQLRRLATRLPLAVVTGRPRAEAAWFLQRAGIRELFGAVVCMEDAPMKPSPEPVQLALCQLNVSSAWMIGDTPDDMHAARAAGVVPLGVVAPEESPAAGAASLTQAGAVRVLNTISELEELLP